MSWKLSITRRSSVFTLPLAAALGFATLSCSSQAPTSENLGNGSFSQIVYAVRQTETMQNGQLNIDVAGGSGQVVDYQRYDPGGRLELYNVNTRETQNIIAGFKTADISGLNVSFDATKVVFSMKKDPNDSYHIYWSSLKPDASGSFGIHQLTFGPQDDLQPVWLAGGKIAFITNEAYTQMGTRADEYEHSRVVTQIATITLTGGDADRKLCSQNLSHSVNLFSMADGKLGFSRWEHLGDVNDLKMFAMDPDCTHIVALAGQHGKPSNSLVQVTETNVPNVFLAVATTRDRTIQAGAIMKIDTRAAGNPALFDEEEPNYTDLTPAVPLDQSPSAVGRYRTPHVLPDGRILVSWANGFVNDENQMSETPPDFGIYIYDPETRSNQLVLNHEGSWELYAQPVVARAEPKVRDSVQTIVDSSTPTVFGSIDVRRTSLASLHGDTVNGAEFDNTPTDQALTHAKKVRIIEGFSSEAAPGVEMFGLTMSEGAAIVGEATVYNDGSWLANLPPYIPMHLQPIDEFDMAIRNQTLWIQGMPGENRVCGGCHERRNSPNLSGGQQLTDAAGKGAQNFDIPIAQRTEYPWYNATNPSNPDEIQSLLTAKCASCHNETTNGNGPQTFYTVTEHDVQTGANTQYKIPRLDLSARPITVTYDNMTGSYTASYVSLFYPAAMAMDPSAGSSVTGKIPPEWAIPSDARESALIEKLNITSSVDPNTTAWPLGQPFSNPDIAGGTRTMHPEDVGVTLTRDERVMLIRAIDLGGQYYSRQNTKFAPYTNDPVSPKNAAGN
jgi:Hydrazine synthase alpha subunit middle domain